jgi:transketolase
MPYAEMRELALRLRKHVLQMTNRAKSSHIGSSFSMIELLVALYGKHLRVRPSEPSWPERDRFILSKGHACAGLYAILAERGFFPLSWLNDFYLDGSRLAGHVTRSGVPGVEFSTGALGHGLSVGCGIALVAKRSHIGYRVFTLLSDGECDEGSTWEAVLFAKHHHLDNLVAIVDYNKIQSLGTVKEVLDLEPFADKWRSFGWTVFEIDGHNLEEINTCFGSLPIGRGAPCCVIAHTVKGKGVSFMEDSLLWHYRTAAGEEFANAMKELEVSR